MGTRNFADPQTQAAAVAAHARQTHERLTLAAWESSYMKLLFPLIPSPRAAKRFVNVYRLLRGVLPNAERASLIGNQHQGGYRAVLLLLAMVTGYPVEATVVTRELLDRARKTGGSEPWWTLLEGIRGMHLKVSTSRNERRLPGQKAERQRERAADSPLPDDEYSQWEELFASLDQVRTNTGHDLSAATMARWAPIVARYSFASGQLLVADRRHSSGADAVH